MGRVARMWPPCHGGGWSSGVGGDVFSEPGAVGVGGDLDWKLKKHGGREKKIRGKKKFF